MVKPNALLGELLYCTGGLYCAIACLKLFNDLWLEEGHSVVGNKWHRRASLHLHL